MKKRKVSINFPEGEITWDYLGRYGTELANCIEFKSSLCKYLNLEETILMVELDFGAETISYKRDGEAEQPTIIWREGLSEQEKDIMGIMGYQETDLTNIIGLVEAFANGEISDALFQLLMEIESLDVKKNDGIQDFLSALQGKAEKPGKEAENHK